MTKHLITIAVIDVEENDDNNVLVCSCIVYVKGFKKREWLADILNRNDLIIEILDTDYKDIDSLCNLDITNMMWKTSVLVKNYITECVQIYNWWSQWQMYQI